ncbi:Mitochondrial zinc maintenance protein 1, mitochondrial [Cyphellophora attinorum]|uniref:Mitochondrial zinc maintenance protein 1, mitochondrial n=1 Tax=Cyphellophora attinorum TaxID=1664694 RepID=A0A0N0NQQ2_9EURO|nr:Mitochondrial zinc maintenance protein 1, mitochondrial [Phialophora attinorum]KPI44168.1 Mitochondrial zinc maintenance protein 1, mitochondrial [Phialophora attinorum]
MALPAYRALLRATRIAFANDTALLHSSRAQIREGFRSKRSLEPGSAEVEGAVKHAEGVAEVLRTNVVQGKRIGGVEGEGEGVYKLNIHKDTERGDNDTVKNPRGTGGVVKVDTGGA